MAKALRFRYDREGDILEIFKGQSRAAISKDMGDDIWLRVDPKTGEILGVTILNFIRRFSQPKAAKIPLQAEFTQT